MMIFNASSVIQEIYFSLKTNLEWRQTKIMELHFRSTANLKAQLIVLSMITKYHSYDCKHKMAHEQKFLTKVIWKICFKILFHSF